jgi:phosphatidylglycerophosphatase A
MRNFVLSFAGLGFLPGAPGTYASVVALAIFCAGAWLEAPGWVWPAAAGISGLLLLAVGVPGDPGGGRSDPRWCVLDEVCGAFVAVTAQPVGTPMLTAAAALVLFRIFDVLKPWPINLLERLPGRWGVLADDVGAGVLANVCLRLLRLVAPRF